MTTVYPRALGAIIFLVTQMTPPSTGLDVLSKFYRGMADLSRLAILTRLQEGEQTSGEIAISTGLSPSNTSRHLACLRECGLVESRQAWRTVYYRLAGGVAELLEHNAAVATQLAERIAACENPAMKLVESAQSMPRARGLSA